MEPFGCAKDPLFETIYENVWRALRARGRGARGQSPARSVEIEEKLRKLEERYRAGEISEETYRELKERLEPR